MRIYLARPGETLLDEQRLFHSRTETSLSTLGKEQAQKLAMVLFQENIGAVYTSNNSYCRQTLHSFVNLTGPQVNQIDELAEVNYGPYEGKGKAQFFADFKNRYQHDWSDNPFLPAPPGVESFDEVKARTAFITDIIKSKPSDALLIMAGDVTYRAITANFLALRDFNWKDLRTYFTGLSMFEFDNDDFSLKYYNSLAHLLDTKD